MKLLHIISFVALIAMATSTRAQQAPAAEDLVNLVEPSLSCGSGLLGGYSPTTLTQSQQKEFTNLALSSYISSQTNCLNPPSSDSIPPAKVLEACSQVVAGTNYAIVFEAPFPCNNESNAVEMERFLAEIYVPLPYTNSPPTVTSVREV